MTYTDWVIDESIKKAELVKKLLSQDMSITEIVDYFDFDNMVKNEPSYCPLYSTNTKCHSIEKLNCFFCGCPYFIYNDNGIDTTESKTIYSTCAIDAKEGGQFHTDTAIHQDCSKCTIPHKPAFAHKKAAHQIKEVI